MIHSQWKISSYVVALKLFVLEAIFTTVELSDANLILLCKQIGSFQCQIWYESLVENSTLMILLQLQIIFPQLFSVFQKLKYYKKPDMAFFEDCMVLMNSRDIISSN